MRDTKCEMRNADLRVGIGYDIHRLEAGRALILGGVTIPFEKGLRGHSDGDALMHAVADAILGAASLGDIGRHFPDTDPVFKDADSSVLLGRVYEIAEGKGWRIVNVDANIIAEKPKMAPHIEAMRARLAEVLSLDVGAVSIKARTNEGVDAVGRGEAIACQSAILLESARRETI